LVVGIGYGSSIEKAIEIMRGLLDKDPRILPEPAALIAVAELSDSRVNFFVRPWVNRSDYWAVKFDFTRAVKEAFDENGIEIPFPQRTVHMAGKSS
jgi:small conductance mechanosensitive channel